MYGHLQLPRDPCSSDYSDDFYVESAQRAKVFAQAAKALDQGRSLWVRGPAGSGRDSLIKRLASLHAPKARQAALLAGKGGPLMTSLAQALGCLKRDASPLEQVEAVYASLLEGFWRGGPCLVFLPALDFADPSDREELSILAGLRTLGHPLALVSGCGAGEPPIEGMEVFELELPGPEEIAVFLRRRLGLCGALGLFDEVVLEVSSSAKGYGRALILLAKRLGALGFIPAAPAPRTNPPERQEHELFSPRDVEEVGWLLDAISRK